MSDFDPRYEPWFFKSDPGELCPFGCRCQEAAAKIESDAKVIAALREALVCAGVMLEESGSGYIAGSRSDTEWYKDRALVIETVKAALAAANEQTAGEK
jgi:hypothetical protein